MCNDIELWPQCSQQTMEATRIVTTVDRVNIFPKDTCAQSVSLRLSAIPPIPRDVVPQATIPVPATSTTIDRSPSHCSGASASAGSTSLPSTATTAVSSILLTTTAIFFTSKIHVSPMAVVDVELSSLWTDRIRERLRDILLSEIPGGRSTHDLMLAGKKPDRLKPTIIITCGDRSTRRQVEKVFKRQKWLKQLLKANGVSFVAATEEVTMSSSVARTSGLGIYLVARNETISTPTQAASSVTRLSTGTIAGISIGGTFFLAMVIVIGFYCRRRRRIRRCRQSPLPTIFDPRLERTPAKLDKPAASPSAETTAPELNDCYEVMKPTRYMSTPGAQQPAELPSLSIGYEHLPHGRLGSSPIIKQPYERDMAFLRAELTDTQERRSDISGYPRFPSQYVGPYEVDGYASIIPTSAYQYNTELQASKDEDLDHWRQISLPVAKSPPSNVQSNSDRSNSAIVQPLHAGSTDSRHARFASENRSQMERGNVRVVMTSDSVTYCGHILCAPISHGEEASCTVGGLLMVDNNPCLLTVSHIFRSNEAMGKEDGLPIHAISEDHSDAVEPFWFSEDDDISNIVTSQKDSEPDSGESNTASEACLTSQPSTVMTMQPNSSAAWTHPRGTKLAQIQLVIKAGGLGPMNNPLSNSRTVPDCDWALLEVCTPDNQLKPLQNSVCLATGTRQFIEEVTTTLASGSVQVLYGNRPRNGTLRQLISTLQYAGYVYDVQMIVLDEVLPPGCSGSWVVQGNKLCGHIVSARRDVPWVYMVSIQAIFADMKQRMGTSEVRLPSMTEIERLQDEYQTLHQEEMRGA